MGLPAAGPRGASGVEEGDELRSVRRKRAFALAVAVAAVALVAVPSAGAWNIGIDVHTSLTRTWQWSIKKSVDRPTVTLEAGQSTTVNYTVVATATGPVDSNWHASGIANAYADPAAPVTVTGMTAVVNPGAIPVSVGPCVPPLPFVLVDPVYTSCPWDVGLPDGSPRSVFVTETTLERPPVTESQAIDFTNATVTKVDDCVSVSDSVAGSLGVVCAGSSPATFTYSRTIGPYPMSQCGDVHVPNTATFTTNTTGTTGSSSADVLVHVNCGQATGALTIGYWRNKNGQAIITGGSSVGTVCKSGTWLRQYAPFQDLSATATCAGVAAYVTTVINNATAAGPTMNAMLKAQMLATALDVYFSNTALGGNKIGAPSPVGGLSIDLTNVCVVGSGVCDAAFVNASSAFGGATHLTVLQILSYASSQSNAGGSVWYGNVKSTQELAKDACDAINNQVAYLF
jgi:hypothetical protein